ncbi:MAG: ComF family protein [Candidatus Contendobacter sp.]|nr:ComF family protein [Candidatus Contendobacter sp.]MDG4556641.1 ComF family protein [Candidatus Contendobacter sp.]
MIAAWLGALERLILPPTCLLCGATGMGGLDLCAGCLGDLPRNLAACPRCAAPLPVAGTGPCARCRAQPPDFDRAVVPFRYQTPVDFMITRLKFNGRLANARLLGELFAAALAERGDPAPDCIVPVPLHPRRLRERGFNQALELARPVARRLGIPLRIDGLRRVRHTLPQVRLDARQRQTNPLGAFARGAPLPGARVALMDDVVTTASTMGECARVLRTGGVTDIAIWAIGRTGGPP